MLSLQNESAGESVEAFHSLHPRPLRDADGHVPPILGQTQLSHQSRRRAFRRTDQRLLGAYMWLTDRIRPTGGNRIQGPHDDKCIHHYSRINLCL